MTAIRDGAYSLVGGSGQRLRRADWTCTGRADSVDNVAAEFLVERVHHPNHRHRGDLSETAEREFNDVLCGPSDAVADRRVIRGRAGFGRGFRQAPGFPRWQGTHFEHDSKRLKAVRYRAKSTAQTDSSKTTNPPDPSMPPTGVKESKVDWQVEVILSQRSRLRRRQFEHP